MVRWQNIWLLLLGLNLWFIFEDLTDHKNDVAFLSKYEKMVTVPQISMCVSMHVSRNPYSSVQNCENIDSSNPYADFVCHVSKQDTIIPTKIIKYARSIRIHRMFNVTSNEYEFKASSIYMNKFHLCITYETNESLRLNISENQTETKLDYDNLIKTIDWNDVDYLRTSTYVPEIKMVAQIFNVYNVSAYLYIDSSNSRAYSFSLHKFFQHCNPKDSICNSGQIVLSMTNYTKLKYPYKTNCFDYERAKFNFTKNNINSKVSCLIECRKLFNPKLNYLYTENDNYELKDENSTTPNSSYTSYCRKLCAGTDCVKIFYYSISWRSLSTSLPIIKLILSDVQYEITTYPVTSQLSYLLQFTSFLCLFYNNNLIAQIMKFHKESTNHLNTFEYGKHLGNSLKKEFVILRIYGVALLLSIILFYNMTDIVIKENQDQTDLSYMAYMDYPINYTHILVTICFPIIEILKDEKRIHADFYDSLNRTDQKLNGTNQKLSEYDILKLNDRLLKEFTLNRLNEITKNESELISATFVYNHLSLRSIKSNGVVSFQPTFRLMNQTKNMVNLTLYGKCFSYNVSRSEYPIQRIFRMSIAYFKILNGHFFSHFVITENDQLPTFIHHKLFTICHLHKLVYKGYKSSTCENYRKSKDGCSSRNECINECIKHGYAKRFRKIPFMIANRLDEKIVDRYGLQVDRVEPYIDQNPEIDIIAKKCWTKFNLTDCVLYTYVNQNSCAKEEFVFNSIRIRLYLPVCREVSMNRWSIVEFANILLTILTVLFGFSAPSILIFILKCVRLIFKIRLSHLKKFEPFIRALLFLWMLHTFDLILLRALSNTPLPNTAYEAFENFHLPRVTTCVSYNFSNITETFKRENKTLTGHILNELTANITIDKLYDRIVFYSENLTTLTINTEQLVKSPNLFVNILSYETFYFQNFKCFNLKLEIFYNASNQKLYEIDDMIRIYLNPNAPIKRMLFSLSPPDTINFNELNTIKNNSINLFSYERYSIKFEDSFKFFRNPKLFFTGKTPKIYDEKNYLTFLRNDIEKRNLTSVLLPIYKESFNIPIKDAEVLKLYQNFYFKLGLHR